MYTRFGMASILRLARRSTPGRAKKSSNIKGPAVTIAKSIARSIESSASNLRRFYHYLREGWAFAVEKGRLYAARLGVGLAFLPILFGFGLVIFGKNIDRVPKIDSIEYLDQGAEWEQYRDEFYSLPQGAPIENIRYKWFVELERPFSEKKFANPNYLRRTGFLIDPKYDARLPVGITKRLDPVLNEYVIDITCAACHTGQIAIEVDGKHIGLRVDGGQAMHAFTSIEPGHFGTALLSSMTATYANPFKFDRFARNVICKPDVDNRFTKAPADCAAYNKESKARLREYFAEALNRMYNKAIPDLKHYPTHEGHGRVDALARIGNRVFGEKVDPKRNYQEGNAPVNYPQLWDIWKFNRVQFTGSVRQPLARNVGQALGTGANYRLVGNHGAHLTKEEMAKTTIEFDNMVKLEEMLQKLQAPMWPSDKLFGLPEWQIDQAKVREGQLLFDELCRGCHGPHVADENLKMLEAPQKGPDQPHWTVVVKPVSVIGTDSNSADNFANNSFDMSRMDISKRDLQSLVRPLWIEQMARTIRLRYDQNFLSEHSEHACPSFGTELCPGENDVENAIARLSETAARDEAQSMWSKIKSDLKEIDPASVKLGEGLNYLGLIIRNQHYLDTGRAGRTESIREIEGFGTLDIPAGQAAYKARPLSGVWATPPFLHNGSVPTIYQLLSPDQDDDEPADRRCDVFYVGLRGYDPKHLGLPVSEEGCGVPPSEYAGEKFKTSEVGNANIGHWFRDTASGEKEKGVIGRELSRDERLQIIEYLKCLRDPPDAPMHPDCTA